MGEKVVQAEFVGTIDLREAMEQGHNPDTDVLLHVWRNPETGRLVAIDNLQLDASESSILDPYNPEYRLVFHDTFTGLPK